MICKRCSKEFTAKRSTAKFCSAKCRKLAFQVDAKVSVMEDGEVSVLPYKVIGEPIVFGPTQIGVQVAPCNCQHCQTNKVNGGKHVINHGAYKRNYELASKEVNRVSLPGDADYTGAATC